MDKKPSHELPEEELVYISRYLNGELGVEAQKTFEARLAIDELFRKQVEEVKTLRLGIREVSLEGLLNDFHETGVLSTESRNGSYSSTRINRLRWGAAAAVVLALIGVWKIWFSLPLNERLYQAYFVPDLGLPVEMSASDTLLYPFYDGMISYKEGNYTDALAKWERIKAVEGTTDTLGYYLGLAYMGADNIDKAMEYLIPVSTERRSVFYEEATWCLALCYLRKDDRQVAISLLQRIDEDDRSRKLLRKLE